MAFYPVSIRINLQDTLILFHDLQGNFGMTKSLAVHTGSPIIEKEFPRWPVWDEKDIQEIEEVIRSGIWGVGGTRLPEFARQFAEFQHVDYVLPVANGSIAIDLALEALGIGKDDEVIVPDYTFMATAVADLS